MAPVRFAAELKAGVRADELAFSIPADLDAVIEMYDDTFVAAFDDFAQNSSTLADGEGHLFYTDCGWGDKEATLLAEALEAMADRCHPLGMRHISCRRDNHFTDAAIQRLMKARTYARRAEATWLDIDLDAKKAAPVRLS